MKATQRVTGFLIPALIFAGAAPAWPAGRELVAVSADVVEISGSLSSQKGFGWNQLLEFSEDAIPGIIEAGDFSRRTALATTLRLLETEGKAQLLSNPKVIAKSGTGARFVVGGDLPFPTVNNQGVGVEFKKFGVILNILPVILPGKKNLVDVQLQLEVSNPDFSNPVTIQNTAVPSIVTRQVEAEIEMQSGETLVIGGLRTSSKNVAITRVPFLGKLPLIGKLFTNTDVREEQRSLFLFVTVEKID